MAIDPQKDQKDEVLANGHAEVVAKTVENGIQVNDADSSGAAPTNGESRNDTKTELKDQAKDEKKEDAAKDAKEKTKTKPLVRYDE